MAKGTGILLDPATGDLLIAARTLVIGNATLQNQFIILNANKGEFKEWPLLGVGMMDMVNDDDITGWKREIILQLEADGMRVNNIGIDMVTNQLIIDAQYSS